ncbi:MAG: hypothetical protein U1F53_01435 [Burkholderiaceae bacterium]
MPTTSPLKSSKADNAIEHLADQAAAGVDHALEATRAAADHAVDSLQCGVEGLRQAGPAALSRAAAQVEDFTRRSMAHARETGAQMRTQVSRAGERSVGYIRDEPVKSVLIAAAAGAAVAALVSWSMRSRAAHKL